jgi:hypothetical protein
MRAAAAFTHGEQAHFVDPTSHSLVPAGQHVNGFEARER